MGDSQIIGTAARVIEDNSVGEAKRTQRAHKGHRRPGRANAALKDIEWSGLWLGLEAATQGVPRLADSLALAKFAPEPAMTPSERGRQGNSEHCGEFCGESLGDMRVNAGIG